MVTSTSASHDGGCDHQRLFDALADPLFVLDAKNADAIRIIVANAACETFFGVPAKRCTGQLLADVLPISAALRISAECDRCKATGQSIEFRLELNVRAFGVRLSLVPDSDTAEHIAAVARAASVYSGLDHDPDAEQFRVIAEYAADFISRCDREARVLYLNPAVERLMGVKYESLVGRDVSEWAGEFPHAEVYRECIRRVVETGKPQMLEAHLPDPSSGRLVYHQVRYAPEWDSNGEVRSVIGIGRDITQLKAAEAELRLLNATLEKRVSARTLDLELANRDLRSFASTVSHDLRAPLRAICGYLGIITSDESEGLSQRGRGLLERAALAATKLDHLINGILEYSKAGQGTLSGEWIPMGALAREVAEYLVPQSSAARVDVADLPAAYADITMARQILQNLIGNAVKFSAGSAQPRIEVGWLEQDGEIIYYVRDNGVGFDMHHAGELYSMFHRLHRDDAFPGSGVGLAIVKRLVERHGGRIWAEGRPSAGATFYFVLCAKPRAPNHLLGTQSVNASKE